MMKKKEEKENRSSANKKKEFKGLEFKQLIINLLVLILIITLNQEDLIIIFPIINLNRSTTHLIKSLECFRTIKYLKITLYNLKEFFRNNQKITVQHL